MAVLVTGAGGYLGQLLTKRLSEEGMVVHALVHHAIRDDVKLAPRIKVFYGDILHPDSIKKAMEGCNAVYHMAALATNWAPTDLYYKVNVEGTENVLKCAIEEGVESVVHTSTAGTIGAQKGDEPVTEEQLDREGAKTYYEKTKILAEDKVKVYANKGLRTVIVNPTRVYGPGSLRTSNAVTKMIQKYDQGKWRIIPGNGKSIGNYVYAEDVIQGQRAAMEHGRAGERYILGGKENIDFDGFFKTLAEVSGKHYPMIHLPMGVMLVIASIMKGWARVSGMAPPITPVWVQKYNKDWGADISKAEEELGYKATPLKEGFRMTLDWIRRAEKAPDE